VLAFLLPSGMPLLDCLAIAMVACEHARTQGVSVLAKRKPPLAQALAGLDTRCRLLPTKCGLAAPI
jgi:hypothetical protein